MKKLLLLTICFSTSLCIGQIKEKRSLLGKPYAQKELEFALTHECLDEKENIIKDSVVAVQVAEPILFSIYGKKNTLDEKPYEIYLIKNHWVIKGTLPEGYLGGTFLIIIDARNGKVIRIGHGK